MSAPGENGSGAYLRDPAARRLVEFFEVKGLIALKDEDRREAWYEDWLAYQAEHRLYATLLSPRVYSSIGGEFNLLRLTRFLEVFGYFSPAHGYSLQVTFLGLFPILMGGNAALKQEAVKTLEAGGLFAFGASEKDHGADLLGNEFNVREIAAGRLVAIGRKYYIGNCNCAAIISILARKQDARSAGRARRAPLVLFALRLKNSPLKNVRKISTIGVRAAFVGEFEVKDHELPQADIFAEGRAAWDGVFGTVTLGKFFLGFGSVGICERAFVEAVDHVNRRVLYGKPVIAMPHIRRLVNEAYARLTAMKLYAFRALDYVQAANANDRRYVLFTAVQKAKVSTQGLNVIAALQECIGAKAFEADTYFEMALRDAPLIPSLEGSVHINLALTAQFLSAYFSDSNFEVANPKSLINGDAPSVENPYLFEARTCPVNTVAFAHFLNAYKPLAGIPNVKLFAKQVKAFEMFARGVSAVDAADTQHTLAIGECLATIAYGQLIAENAAILHVSPQIISVIFHLLVLDLSGSALAFAGSIPRHPRMRRLRAMVIAPVTTGEDWKFVSEHQAALRGA